MKQLSKTGIISLSLSMASAAFAAVPKASKAELDTGKAAYLSNNCAACHGEKGDGQGPAGASLNPKPRNFLKDTFKKGDSFENIFETISKGLPGTTMMAYGHLPEATRKALAHYILSLRKK